MKIQKIEDLLDISRSRSDILWIMKDYESKIPYFSNYKNNEFLRSNTLKSKEFIYDIKLISDKTGICQEELLVEAEEILNGMSHNLGMNSVRVMGVMLCKLMKSIYQSIFVDVSGLNKIREAHRKGPVVLLPTHRSYADFLLVSFVMFNYDLPLPVTAAAMDFMGMKFVGELLRRCGAFFIRRSFAKDELYWTVFGYYVKSLLRQAQEPLQFFIEGTRSRTNKSLYPKSGLLGILLESWLINDNINNDITIIPISISYDRVLEEKLYGWELLGVPKPKESTKGLLKVRHILNDNYGNVYFNIGDPISIAAVAMKFGVTRYSHNLQLKFRPTLFDKEKKMLHWLAHNVVTVHQDNFVVSDWSLVAMVIMHKGCDWLNKENEARDYLIGDIAKLLQLNRINPISLDKTLELHHNLLSTVHSLCARFNAKSNDRISKYQFDDESLVNWMILSNYRNCILYHVAKESILLMLISNSCSESASSCDSDDIRHSFSVVMEILSREFIYTSDVDELFDSTLSNIVRYGYVSQDNNTIIRCPPSDNLSSQIYSIIQEAVRPHVIGYYIYGHILVTANQTTPTNKSITIIQSQTMRLVRGSMYLATMGLLEIVSVSMIKNFVAALRHFHKISPQNEITNYMNHLKCCINTEILTNITNDILLNIE